jgi:hypothetical protein
MLSTNIQAITLPKEIHRLETIGKSGKINKAINITIKQLDLVR